jgi:hypothetical protein
VETELPKDLGREVRQTLADLRVARLAATAWPVIAGDVARLERAVERCDGDAVRKALVPISQATFEGKVRGRLAGANRAAAYVAATKQTSALPLVGAVSALVLMVVGYLLGGWPVLLGTAVFALFIFGVAYAGSHSNRDRVDRRHAQGLAPTKERTEPAPSVVAEAITQIEAQLAARRPPDT